MSCSLLINPVAEGAFYGQTAEVALQELKWVTGLSGELTQAGPFTFIETQGDIPQEAISRLSCIQGAFKKTKGGLKPLVTTDSFVLPKRLVFGARYPGKTHELLTQLCLNIALGDGGLSGCKGGKLLDPMAGRGTTLLWAARYGLSADGVELDEDALVGFQREAKKTTKLERVKHQNQKGRLAYVPADYSGKYSEFTWQGVRTRLIHGDSRYMKTYIGKREKYRWIVSDIPYGIYHAAGGKRNPIDVLADGIGDWADLLEPGGRMVLAFNSYLPKRKPMKELFESVGLQVDDAAFQHRVSESILRQLIVGTKPH